MKPGEPRKPISLAEAKRSGRRYVFGPHDGARARARRLKQLTRQDAQERAKRNASGKFRCEACLEDFDPSEAVKTTSDQLVCKGCADYLYVEHAPATGE